MAISARFESVELGIGTWQWGDRLIWNYGLGYGAADIRAAFDTSLAAGLRFFDTAEIYGMGRSERFLGRFLQSRVDAPPVQVATKFFPFPWRLLPGQLPHALRGSLSRLGLPAVDLYQIHWSLPPVSIETWMAAMAEAVAAGLTRAVGVSNYDARETRRAHAALARRGVPLASNQVHYSLLNRRVEGSGLLALCAELGVRLIAYSPLEKGLLTGKYTPQRRPPGARMARYGGAYLASIQPLIQRLRALGEAHGGKTPAQVALNWVICKGALPIPGVKNARQAQENAGGAGWRLSAEEVAELDRLSLSVQTG